MEDRGLGVGSQGGISGSYPALVPKGGATLRAQKRLELLWCSFPGDWEQFLETVRERDNPDELRVLELYPAEFRLAAVERATRVVTHLENQLPELLAKMGQLTEATKVTTNGDTIPDNATRLKATQYLIDRAMGAVTERKGPAGETGDGIQNVLERREEIRRILNKDGTGTETRTVTERSG